MTDLQKQLAACLIIRSIAYNAKIPGSGVDLATDLWEKHISDNPSGDGIKNAVAALNHASNFCDHFCMEFYDRYMLENLNSMDISVLEQL